jgi:hypothetical protein
MKTFIGNSRIINYDEKVRVERVGCVQYVDGKPQRSESTTFEIQCHTQPLKGIDLLLVPEGDRTKDQRWLWTRAQLQIKDVIFRQESRYQIQTVEAWQGFIKVRMVRIDTGDNATA